MNLNEPLYAVVEPVSGRVLGDGDCPSLYSSLPERRDLEWIAELTGVSAPEVRQVVLVPVEDLNRLTTRHEALQRRLCKALSGALWLAAHPQGTPVPAWVDEALTPYQGDPCLPSSSNANPSTK